MPPDGACTGTLSPPEFRVYGVLGTCPSLENRANAGLGRGGSWEWSGSLDLSADHEPLIYGLEDTGAMPYW